MKIKHIINATLCAVALGSLTTSCRFEEADFFTESASLRLDHANEAIEKILCSASASDPGMELEEGKFGWCIQYFTSGTEDGQYKGGYNLFAKFYPNHVVVMSNNIIGSKNVTSASNWEMLKEEGSVLAFNTWNDVLMPYVDPEGTGKADYKGEGRGGDNNLVMMTYSDNVITFRGQRHNGRTRFVRLDCPMNTYIANTLTMKEMLLNNTFYVTNGVDTMYLKDMVGDSPRPSYVERLEDPLVIKKNSAVYTPDGFYSERVDTIFNLGVQEWKINEEKSALIGVGNGLKMIPMWDYVLAAPASRMNISAEDAPAEIKDILTQLEQKIKTFDSKATFKSVGIVLVSQRPVLQLVWNKSGEKKGAININMSRTAYGEIKISNNPDATPDNNLKAVENKAEGTVALMHQLAALLADTYNVVPDDYFSPTGGVFTSKDGQKVITFAE